MKEDAWEWPDTVRRKLHPRRGGVEAIFRKTMTGRAAFRKLSKACESEKGFRGPVFEKLRSDAKTAPALLTPEEEAPMVCPLFTMPWGAEMVDYWVALGGAPFALRALLATHQLSNCEERGWYTQTHCVTTGWERLRQRLSTADETEFGATLEAAEAAWLGAQELDDDDQVRFWDQVRLAYAFPSRPDWANDATDAYLRRSTGLGIGDLYHSLVDVERMHALLKRGPISWRRGAFFSFVEGAGVDAQGPIISLLTSGKRHPSRKERVMLYETLALIPSDDAMRCLLQRFDENAVRSALMSAATRWPTRAVRLIQAELNVKRNADLVTLQDMIEKRVSG